MNIKKIDIKSRTDWMYLALNKIDKFNKLDISKVADCAEFVSNLLNDLIDGIEWEIWCLKKSGKFRGDSLELTFEISCLLDGAKIGCLYNNLKINSNTRDIAKQINKLNSRYSYLNELGETIQEFEDDLSLALEVFHSKN